MIMQGCVIPCGTVVFFQKSRNLSRSLLTDNNFYFGLVIRFLSCIFGDKFSAIYNVRFWKFLILGHRCFVAFIKSQMISSLISSDTSVCYECRLNECRRSNECHSPKLWNYRTGKIDVTLGLKTIKVRLLLFLSHEDYFVISVRQKGEYQLATISAKPFSKSLHESMTFQKRKIN